uniref:(California timema) hypothetical protein n=1 Tax=Timema californicum TaxID=61474 RepID=A0A7R9JJT2_TIMCA|nr:unnamed protein product [Timema californicum]
MSARDNEEFKNAIRDLSYYAMKLDSPYAELRDRAGCTELALDLPASFPLYLQTTSLVVFFALCLIDVTEGGCGGREYKLRQNREVVPENDTDHYRVRCSEWVRKLSGMRDDDFESARSRNEYLQYLRVMLRAGLLHGMFKNPPPDTPLPPFAECVVRIDPTREPVV